MLTLFNLLPGWLRLRLFIAFSLTRRAMTLGVRCVVQDSEGRVLLVKHTYVPGWHFPGGGVERGETMQQAAKKELQEEAHLTMTDEPLLIAVYKNPRTSRFDHVALFKCDNWTGKLPTEGNWEIEERGFFPLDDLPVETLEPTRTRLKEVFEKQPKRELW